MSGQIFTLIGGNGFIGRQVAKKLLRLGHSVRIAARDPQRNMDALAQEFGEHLSFHPCDLKTMDGLENIVDDAYGVVNFVGILHEGGAQSFMDLQAEAAGEVAEMAYENGVGRFVHMSAVGADTHSPSLYAQSKAIGEINVTTAFPAATILRPSIVVGEGDGFFGRFSKMVRMTPFVLGFAGGSTRFQPVQVDDVAEAVVVALTGLSAYEGTYELGGPKIYSFKELLKLMLGVMGKKRLLMDMPLWLATPMAALLEKLPEPPLTRDQLKLLAHDNIIQPKTLGFTDLGITPKPIEDIIESAIA